MMAWHDGCHSVNLMLTSWNWFHKCYECDNDTMVKLILSSQSHPMSELVLHLRISNKLSNPSH